MREQQDLALARRAVSVKGGVDPCAAAAQVERRQRPRGVANADRVPYGHVDRVADTDGNVVVVNVSATDNNVLTFDPASGKLLKTEQAVEAGNDGIVVLADGTKYVSSVRYGSVSEIKPGQPAKIIASGIPSAASMGYDSKQNQLLIPMNPNNSVAFIKLGEAAK